MLILDDIKAKSNWLYGKTTPLSILRASLSDATMAMILYRAMSWSNKIQILMPFTLLLHKLNAILCGCVIGINAQFGKRFIILHSVGIVINSALEAGDDVTLESGVVIGAEKGLSPLIGSRIFVGSGAKIIGGIEIGNDISIGANSVVLKDVPSSSVAVGVPARIIIR